MTDLTPREASEDRARDQIVVLLKSIRAFLLLLIVLAFCIGALGIANRGVMVETRHQIKDFNGGVTSFNDNHARTQRILCAAPATRLLDPRDCDGR